MSRRRIGAIVALVVGCSSGGEEGEELSTLGPASSGDGTTGPATGTMTMTPSTSITASASTTAGSTMSTGSMTGAETTQTTSTTGPPLDPTCYDIQQGRVPALTTVTVDGIVVTGIAPAGNAFFAQHPTGGPYSGCYMFVDDMDISGLELGDEVTVTGIVGEFNGLTEINASSGTVTETAAGVAVVPDTVALADHADERWEAVLVTIDETAQLVVTSQLGGDEFEVTEALNTGTVDDYLYSVIDNPGAFPNFGVAAEFDTITGVVNFNNEFKIAPRMEADFTGYVEGPDLGVDIDTLSAGDLVITEVMMNPSQGACASDIGCEWFEIFNAAGVDVNLNGLLIDDDDGMMSSISVNATLPDGAYGVIGDDAAVWPYATFTPLAQDNIALTNSNTEFVRISNAGGMIDQTATWTSSASGRSLLLFVAPDHLTNDLLTNWCRSNDLFETVGGDDEYGTPAATNVGATCL